MLCRNIRQIDSYANCRDSNQVTHFPDHSGHNKQSNNLLSGAMSCLDMHLRSNKKKKIPILPKTEQSRKSAKRKTVDVYYRSRGDENKNKKSVKKNK